MILNCFASKIVQLTFLYTYICVRVWEFLHDRYLEWGLLIQKVRTLNILIGMYSGKPLEGFMLVNDNIWISSDFNLLKGAEPLNSPSEDTGQIFR